VFFLLALALLAPILALLHRSENVQTPDPATSCPDGQHI
jgi:hypothetical protein